jgi:hypothetical protein
MAVQHFLEERDRPLGAVFENQVIVKVYVGKGVGAKFDADYLRALALSKTRPLFDGRDLDRVIPDGKERSFDEIGEIWLE